jgi:hypothetical protein
MPYKRTGRKPGNPPVEWTPEREGMIFGALAAGCTYADAASIAGISVDSLERRRRADPSFDERLSGARVRCKIGALTAISRAICAGQWKAAAFFLARAYPDEFGWRRPDRVRALDPIVPATPAFPRDSRASEMMANAIAIANAQGRETPPG